MFDFCFIFLLFLGKAWENGRETEGKCFLLSVYLLRSMNVDALMRQTVEYMDRFFFFFFDSSTWITLIWFDLA